MAMLESDTIPQVATLGPGRVLSSRLPDVLISGGRYWASAEEVQALLGGSADAARHALAALQHQKKIFSPARGFYVVIPPEYRAWGSVPGDWFIDPMMKHLKRTYYVSFLTAAAIHGASHQAPQTFQVMIPKYLPGRDVGRTKLRFTASRHVADMAQERQVCHTGYFLLASRESTIVDLAWRQREGGGISNVATVLKEIGELDGDQLARLAPIRGRSTARRLGWLIERYRQDVDPHWLRLVAQPDAGEPAFLSPGSGKRGHIDKRWGLLLNTEAEPDL